MTVESVIGGVWGDEGKGKLVDLLALKQDFVCRYNGGANAGHTIVHEGNKFKLNLLPSGIIHPNVKSVIGNGVVLNIPKLFSELESLEERGIDAYGRLLVSDRCHILLECHKEIDGLRELSLGDKQIGTTKRGIGPCYSSKINRNGVRAAEIKHNWEGFKDNVRKMTKSLSEEYKVKIDAEKEIKQIEMYREKLVPMIVDTVSIVNKAINNGKNILIEGANAVLLDIDFGTYPFVTSSSPSIGGACTGLGISPKKIDEIYAVVKSYTTRVGEGPFPTELNNELGEKMRSQGFEFGTTTGRPRRCGWIDIPLVNYSTMINGFTKICLTKLDVLSGFEEIKLGVEYTYEGKPLESFPASLDVLGNVEVKYETMKGWKEDISGIIDFKKLPTNAQLYVKRIEQLLSVPIKWIGTGPGRNETIIREV